MQSVQNMQICGWSNIFVIKVYSEKMNKNIFSDLIKSKLFWLGFSIKIFCAAIFASKFLSDLFLPFIDFYVGSSFANPYEHFAVEGRSNMFPYPSLMLWILSAPYFLYIHIAELSVFLAIFSLKISLIIADFVILIILLQWLKGRVREVILFYWLSPVLIYISYIHGQLDAIPIAILFTALYFLFKEKFIAAAIFLALAISCKTHIIIALPFFLVYLFLRHLKVANILAFVAAVVVIFIAINAHYLSSQGFIATVLMNSEQGKIFDSFYQLNHNLFFFFIPAAYLLLLAKSLSIKGYNRDIFIMFLGFGFGVINIFIPPMQGWYYWIIPFLTYFYIKQKNAPIYLFLFLQISYIAYFAAIKNSDFFQVFQFISPQISSLPNLYEALAQAGFNSDQLVSIVFTILQTALILNCFWIYRDGINNYLKHKLSSQPYLIGISGDSGAGKTTLVEGLSNIFGGKNIATICGDDMHKWERGHDKWQDFTHLNPSANSIHGEISFLQSLKNGQKIMRKLYDHGQGKFTKPREIRTNRIVIFEGLHSFYIEAVRKIFDVKIFIKPEERLRLHWKITRDQAKRGYSREKIVEQLKKREEDSYKFIASQEKFSDIKIEIFPTHEIRNIGDVNEKINLKTKIIFSNNIDVEPFINATSKIESLNIVHAYGDRGEQSLEISGLANIKDLEHCGNDLLSYDFDEINFSQPKWIADIAGVIQVFLAFYIIKTELKNK